MRLSEKEKSAIVQAVNGIDPNAKIYLFGSRADDTKRGGDIDLLILSQTLDRGDKRKIKFELYEAIGEQKIDILIAKDLTDPFVRMARSGEFSSLNDTVKNLKSVLTAAANALSWLERSYLRCASIGLKEEYSKGELDLFENLTSRFARASDILIHKVFRALDAVELESGGTLIDVVNRAHKRELFDEVDEIREIKDIRNEIAHEYVQEDLVNVFADVLRLTPKLFEISQRTTRYAEKYLNASS